MIVKNTFGNSWICLLLLCLLGQSACQSKPESYDPDKESIFDQFVRDTLVQLTIETDFQHLIENKFEAEYQPAVLTYTGHEGDAIRKNIEVSARGVTRKKICEFPPLKLRFSKKELAARDLQEFHTLKLVTHCLDSLQDDQILLKEYLAYKLLNLLTEQSFQVQMARVQYVDMNGRFPSEEKYAFLIENNKEMAARLQGKLLNEDEYELKAIDRSSYNLLALFQYMIGNTDWNLTRHHNIKLVLPEGREVPLAIPYDFDYSGLVNAPYAVPYASLPISSVRERYFQWRGKDLAELEPVIQRFREQKEAILSTCRNLAGLQPQVRDDLIEYLESFYRALDNPQQLAAKN